MEKKNLITRMMYNLVNILVASGATMTEINFIQVTGCPTFSFKKDGITFDLAFVPAEMNEFEHEDIFESYIGAFGYKAYRFTRDDENALEFVRSILNRIDDLNSI